MSEFVNIEATWKKSEAALVFEGQQLRLSAAKWITEYYGERCQDVAPNCPCCNAWKALDELFRDLFTQ